MPELRKTACATQAAKRAVFYGWIEEATEGAGWRCGAEEATEIKNSADATHPEVVLNGGDHHARVDGEPAGDRRIDRQQDDRLENLDDGILRAAVEVVDHHAQPQGPTAAELLIVVVLGAQHVVQPRLSVMSARPDDFFASSKSTSPCERRRKRAPGTSAANPAGSKPPRNCSGASASSGGRHLPSRLVDVQSQNSPTPSEAHSFVDSLEVNSPTASEAVVHKNTRSSCSKAKYSPMAVTRPHAVASEASTRRWRIEHRRFCRLVSGESEGSSF
eukprot:scaffold20955_cov66-Phaeocystis_antarctica.AAC.5